jgi:hypothetical protein
MAASSEATTPQSGARGAGPKEKRKVVGFDKGSLQLR